MKKSLLVLVIALILFLAACTTTEASVDEEGIVQIENSYVSALDTVRVEEMDEYEEEDGLIYISEQFFASRINDIILNDFSSYLGRTIRYEGMFWSVYWEWTGQYYHYVIRYAYGCCGDHYSSVGFELFLDGIAPPPDGTWVEVIGILERSDGDGISHVRLRLTSLILMEERGLEFVPN